MVPGFLAETDLPYLDAYPLADCSTFRLGGPCRGLVQCATPEELERAVQAFDRADEPFVLIAGASNLLISDSGIDAFVIRYVANQLQVEEQDGVLEVSGSSSLDALAAWCAENGWEGLGFSSGIPGTVGGAVAGNAGAWGRQMADVVEQVSLLDRRGCIRQAAPEELDFRYRSSAVRDSMDIISSVRLRVMPGDNTPLRAERARILAERAMKHPNLDDTPCIGSFFRNIEPTSAAERRQAAGWFLEQAGAKALQVGGARLYEKHANIIVADHGCRADDVFRLFNLMAYAVYRKFGLRLEREIRLLGSFPGVEAPCPLRFS